MPPPPTPPRWRGGEQAASRFGNVFNTFYDWSHRIRKRVIHHAVLVGFTLAAIWLTQRFYIPRAEPVYLFTIAFGYESMVLLALTLVIGVVNLIRVRRLRRNPVNLYLRRDIGIWAGMTAIAHAISGLFVNPRGSILNNFFVPGTFTPRLDTRGFYNYVGLVAVILVAVLLITSTDYALKRLKGKRWKQIQRFNYAVVALAILHTLGYQAASGRESPFITATLIGLVIVGAAQFVGMWVTTVRKPPPPLNNQ